MPARYKDDFAKELDAEMGFKPSAGWFRVDVPRKSGGTQKKDDPYWFHPTGWRFRSRSEVARWRDSGWDVNALQNTAFCNRENHDGLGLTRQEAIDRKLISEAGAEGSRPSGAGSTATTGAGKEKKSKAAASSSSAATAGSTPESSAPARSKRARADDEPTSSEKSSRKASAAAAADDDEEEEEEEDDDEELTDAPGAGSAATTTSAKASLKSVVAYAEDEQPVLDIYQKDHILASVRVTHSFGSSIADLMLPSSIYFCQRTTVDVVNTSIRIPYLHSIGEELPTPATANRAAHVAVLRAEVIPETLTRSSPTAPSGLATLSTVLCTRERVGLAQTSHSANQQIVLLPPFAMPPGTDADTVKSKKLWWVEVKSFIDEILSHRTTASGAKGASVPTISGSALFAPPDSASSDGPIGIYLLCTLRDSEGPNLRTHLGGGEMGCTPPILVTKGDTTDDKAPPDVRAAGTIPAPKTFAKWAKDKSAKKKAKK